MAAATVTVTCTVRRRTWLIRIAAWFYLAGETEIAGWLVAKAIVVRAA